MATLPLEDLPSLALFARVVQLRSFTAAANEAGLAKSAVSRRITALEERLGTQLLLRSTRKLALTDDGVRVYEHCAALVEAARAASEAMAGAETAVRGTLRISAPVTFSQMHLAAAVADFLRLHPDLDVDLRAEDRLVDVVEGGYDVVVRISRLKDSALVARRLATDRLVVVGAPRYLDARGTPTTPAELLRHDCLHYSLVPLAGEWRFRTPEREPITVPVRARFSASDGGVLVRAALEGLGLVVCPSFMVAEHVRAGRLRLVLEGHRRAEVGIYAVVAERRQLPRRTRAFVDFLVKRFDGARW